MDLSKGQEVTIVEENTPTVDSNGNASVLNQVLHVDTLVLSLKAAIDFTKEFFTNKSKSRNLRQEVTQSIRTVCKKTMDLLNWVKFDLSKDQQELVIEGMTLVSESIDRFIDASNISDEYFSRLLCEIGMEHFICMLINSLVDGCEDAMKSCVRGNFAHEVVERLKSVKLKRIILDKLCEAMRRVLNRFYMALNGTGKSTVIDLTDISSSFRFLQLMELVIVSDSAEPWIKKEEVENLIAIEKTCQSSVNLANVQIFLSRVVTLARKFEKPEEELMETESDGDF